MTAAIQPKDFSTEATDMNYWWVNQNQTYVHEVGGGYLWSPKVNANGRRNRFYDSMTEAAPGDLVFSFCDTYIKAIGVVIGTCQSSPKHTEFGAAGEYWAKAGISQSGSQS
jgi:putative restriction endonuclease